MQYVIIGYGAAGSHAAQVIRQRDPNGVINIISEEGRPPYYRPLLDKLLGDEITEDKMFDLAVKFAEADRILVASGVKAMRLLPKEKRVCLDTGDRFPYDKLVIATGLQREMPQLAGPEVRGIYQLRMLAGVARTNNIIREGATGAVVYGGGIGDVALAAALAKRGLRVTYLTPETDVGAPVLGGDAATLIRKILESHGVRIVLGDSVVDAVGEDGKLQSVQAASGEIIPCQILLCARPMVPNVGAFMDIGLEMPNGIAVSSAMTTNLPDIWAAGGVATIKGDPPVFVTRLGATWEASAAQGRVAGANMTGAKEAYVPKVPVRQFRVYPLDVAIIGRSMPLDANIDEVRSEHSSESSLRQLVVRDGVLVGATLVGDLSTLPDLVTGIQEGRRVDLP